MGGSIADLNGVVVDLITPLKNGEIQNVVGIIDRSGDIEYFKGLLPLGREGFKVFCGSEKDIYDSVQLGNFYGVVSGIANAASKFVVDVCQTSLEVKGLSDNSGWRAKFVANWKAKWMQRKMNRACKLLYGKNYEHVVSGLKHALSPLYRRTISKPEIGDVGSVEIKSGNVWDFHKLTRYPLP
jgi:dihydrodipicolinate synthase/N-acetylneuraminate lyase|tara:strand:- start:6 stop:554 length:549 start_codon:yes stop_codon:yes gene_type:complete